MSKRMLKHLFLGLSLVFLVSVEVSAQSNPYYKLSRKQRKVRAEELYNNFNSILDEAMLNGTEKQLKQEMLSFGIYYDKKASRAMWTGIGGGCVGLGLVLPVVIGVNTQSVAAAISTGVAGFFGGLCWAIFRGDKFSERSKFFISKSREIIVIDEASTYPIRFDFGDSQLGFGPALIPNNLDNTYAFGSTMVYSF